MKGFVIAGTASGVGKTVATLTAIRALSAAGYTVQPAKGGPDFIDPSHHTAVAGRASRTLDPWLCGEAGMRRNYYRGEGDICIVEGMMGLYDGETSTARVAELLDLPVVLVCDASAGMESVAASALGFREYAAHAGVDIDVVGIIAGRAHGGRHERGIREALPDSLSYFGRIPPLDGLEIPERHLGLHMGGESPIDLSILDEAAAHLDADALAALARAPPRPDPAEPRPATGTRVAVARDGAFCFRYPATIERLQERAEVVPFSPIRGDALPECDGVYLPGGYPELHAAALADSPALETLAERASEGLAVLGVCGGLMALAESLTTVEGERYDMAGVLPADIEMCERYQALDHVELRAREDTLSARKDESLRGHEFHYSSAAVGSDARFAFDVERGAGIDGEHDGLSEYRTLGTYTHVHAESGAFDRFCEAL
ncbi:cobyrinic acid a,c-diamide synthase [Halalkalicoccus jeotgali]|uniref:Cobyrinate a,c-diamide synthase n=1 Tax=Halalkalicoccus jeotgali (strain DSM 18796 / CECT 7217 / JCM 14584 / KCTC 4019 / B3) TaxID=795797 RepID=D8J709_HALJB|nr:cobyrinic acid a,c-diamide synthase [Halalkalicoccus jeotgali]ADJ15962.1 cobyrinic acid a,c-diamide synthase [Halalkalicoccus jeotgali B3]ELY38058.1 cobyrinic acid a,c-diamide synthase [Halalkalicoccus jeotgali B3]